MNVFRQLCSPFIDALSENETFDIIVPMNADTDMENILENEMDEENMYTKKKAITRQVTDLDGCRSYAQIMAVACFVLELRTDGRTVSLRDVYYALKSLFRNQRECNAIILEVGRVLKLKRHEMNIIPASKGFVSGHFRFRFHSALPEESQPMDIVQPTGAAPSTDAASGAAGSDDEGGPVSGWNFAFESTSNGSTAAGTATGTGAGAGGCTLVGAKWTSCPVERIQVEWLGGGGAPAWLLVVEKEGVFHRLLEERFTERMNCIMVTGCGYPDMATRALVSKLNKIFPRMRVVGLCDYNPHGLALLLTYRFASVSSKYESQGLQADVRWLGLRAVHIREFMERSAEGDAPSSTNTTSPTTTTPVRVTASPGTSSAFAREQLQELSLADTRKIRALLNTMNTTAQELPVEYGQELHQMLIGGVKCELESCYSLGLAYLPHFLERCMHQRDYI